MNPILIRLLVIAVALIVWFQTQKLIAARAGSGKRIGDGVHWLTRRLHHYFATHKRAADRALIGSSFCIDVLGFSLIALSVFASSFAPFIAMMIVFTMRQISQMCCTLPAPPRMIWRDPGFPTALVTYKVGNDFFFSGHTALAVLGAIEICRIAPWWLGAIAVVIAIGEALIVLILRAHYTMDVITGALAAWLAADLAESMVSHADHWFR